MWNSALAELQELLWLLSMVTGLSAIGVILAIALAVALVSVA
jgi:hypothetical protein